MVGAAVGLTVPAVAPTLESATTPVLAVLLFATFLGVPMASLGRAFRDSRFLVTVSALRALTPDEAQIVLERLHDGVASLRTEVAAAISRRKVPLLAFQLAPGGGP